MLALIGISSSIECGETQYKVTGVYKKQTLQYICGVKYLSVKKNEESYITIAKLKEKQT